MSQEFSTVKAVTAHLKSLPKAKLVAMLSEVAANLAFNSEGDYSPEDATAWNSGADYVEQVINMFHRNEISL